MRVIGIGTNIVECLRIAQMIERHGELFLNRVYTADEIAYCSVRKSATQHFAGRWAAKEAALKALGISWARGIKWHDIEVRNKVVGNPEIVLHGGALEESRRQGITEVMISISHCRTHATAFATAIDHED